ncbi:MAG: methylated-DNA--[protein]-cysteine S-methyltransferase [Alphaproteobacteria bacterium]|nr:methylated-DNA--[protein]-cysteine S-methyltransferase [Alphaproteobacteria bacterium]MBL7096382.1 methylated-DNA--[protein]-cysteine S-methyltransferase [Alphaproteobacteria bacterium]
MSEELFLDTVKTPIGSLLLVADARGVLRMLEFEDRPERWRSIFRRHFKDGEFRKKRDPGGVASKLKRYFDGDIAALDEIKVDAHGTDFQLACWRNLRKIPAGSSTSYGALAKKMGRPSAMRAVGLANGANPIAVVVPCHRVVGADGSLTGYGGGLGRKRWLLDHEARHAAKKRKTT